MLPINIELQQNQPPSKLTLAAETETLVLNEGCKTALYLSWIPGEILHLEQMPITCITDNISLYDVTNSLTSTTGSDSSSWKFIVYIRVSPPPPPPPSKTPSHLSCQDPHPLKSANCPSPPFYAIPPLYQFFMNSPPKIGIFCERPKY